jgi:hypothetical protein
MGNGNPLRFSDPEGIFQASGIPTQIKNRKQLVLKKVHAK